MTGSPASGKTTYIERHLSGHVRISQDELKTLAKCKNAAKTLLPTGCSSIVIDATNRDIATRKQWIDLARQYSLPVYSIYLDYPKPLCQHLNAYRLLTNGRHVPTVALSVFYKKVEPPTTAEGLTDVFRVTEFVVGPDCDPRMWMHLVG